MLKADLHVHSGASPDGAGTVDDVLSSAVEHGLDAVAVTDHDNLGASLDAVDAAEDYEVLALPGVEVTSEIGHVLALGVEEPIAPRRPIEETVEAIREAGGVAVIPHPFQQARHGVGAVADCDGVETFNSRLITGRGNRQADAFADEQGLPKLAGSDAHTPAMVGRAYTEIDAEPTRDAILDAIREGRTTPAGTRTPLLTSLKQFLGNRRRPLPTILWTYLFG